MHMPKDRLKSDAHMLHIHMQHKQSGTFRLTLPCTEATDLAVRIGHLLLYIRYITNPDISRKRSCVYASD